MFKKVSVNDWTYHKIINWWLTSFNTCALGTFISKYDLLFKETAVEIIVNHLIPCALLKNWMTFLIGITNQQLVSWH